MGAPYKQKKVQTIQDKPGVYKTAEEASNALYAGMNQLIKELDLKVVVKK